MLSNCNLEFRGELSKVIQNDRGFLSPKGGCWETRGKIGQGAHGVVFIAYDKLTHRTMAVKQIDTNGINEIELAALQNEIEMMRTVSHENIVQYFGTEHDKNILNIFMELAPGGSLQSQLRKCGCLDERTVKKYTRQLLCGLKYLHDKEITHRDIKSANLLLSGDGTIKLADFGASKRMSSNSIVSGLKGTPHWMAPEVIKAEQTTEGWVKADVWSVGCTVIEMVTGHSPWQEYPNPMTAMYQIACGNAVPKIPTTLSAKGQDFIKSCLIQNPNDRPDVKQLLDHPFVATKKTSKIKDKKKKKMKESRKSNSDSNINNASITKNKSDSSGKQKQMETMNNRNNKSNSIDQIGMDIETINLSSSNNSNSRSNKDDALPKKKPQMDVIKGDEHLDSDEINSRFNGLNGERLYSMERSNRRKPRQGSSPRNMTSSEKNFYREQLFTDFPLHFPNQPLFSRSATPVFPSLSKYSDIPRPVPRQVSTAPAGSSSSKLSYKLPPLNFRTR